MIRQLEEMYEKYRQNICRLYFPNQKNLYRLGMDLRLSKTIAPARADKFKVLRIQVDPNPDFTWPFTYTDDGGEMHYVFFTELHQGIQVLPHMQKHVEWVSIADFNVEDYEQVVAGRLSVPGAWFDTERALRFDFEMMPYITTNAISADTHTVLDASFDNERYVARRDAVINAGTPTEYTVKRGEHVHSFTLIDQSDVWHKDLNPDGLWWPVRKQERTYGYLGELKAQDEVPNVTWNKHNTRMTFGAGIDPVVWGEVMLHSYARDVEPVIFLKGLSDEEFFGIFAPQVVVPGNPNAQVNIEGLQLTLDYDLIVIDKEAFTHCVLHTVKQLVRFTKPYGRSVVERLRVATDGSSSIPGFEAAAHAAYGELVKEGLKLATFDEIEAEIKDRAQ